MTESLDIRSFPRGGRLDKSPSDSIFGLAVAGADVEDMVITCLQTWSMTYLAEVARQHNLPETSLPRVRAWVPSFSYDKWPEDQLPAVFVISTGTAERPSMGGDGTYFTRWAVQIGVLCSANTQQAASKLAWLYVLAHRMLLDQRSSLDGQAMGTKWVGEGDMPLNYDDTRTLAGRITSFVVDVEDTGNKWAGPKTPDAPLDPDTQPWPPWATADIVQFEIDNVRIDEPMPTPTREEE